jgi:hypothetical protein
MSGQQLRNALGGQQSQTSNRSPNLSSFGQMALPYSGSNMANFVTPLSQNRPMQQPNYQSSMPSFEQLVGGGYNPMQSIAAMQRQPMQSVQNPFFGGSIPMDFSAPFVPMQSFAPRYSSGQANQEFEAQKAREQAAMQAAMQATTRPPQDALEAITAFWNDGVINVPAPLPPPRPPQDAPEAITAFWNGGMIQDPYVAPLGGYGAEGTVWGGGNQN